jgi:uncharacterized protein YndB with AHSA1/START domain
MSRTDKTTITVSAMINAPVKTVWNLWTGINHIMHWNNASDDWHTTRVENDLNIGGKFLSRMEARDGSVGFDFTGVYSKILPYELIEYKISDGRSVRITFASNGNGTNVEESFEAEKTNPVDIQRSGWQAILNNFKKYTESYGKSELMHFEIKIDCEPEKVYKLMLDENSYKEWTMVFNPTSHYKGSWEKGSEILFLGSDADGNTGGMASKIKENIPGRFISIEHLGSIRNGKETTSGYIADEWSGSLENYTFTDLKRSTLLQVDIDCILEFKSYFIETWPAALDKLKSICEK